jgi:hypothetical protein
MGLKGTGAADRFGPTRLIRRSPSSDNTMLRAIGTASSRVCLELSDLELHGAGRPAMLADFQVGNTVELHRVRFSGASATGVRMRNIYNSSGSHLRFVACGNGSGQPAVVFDGVSGAAGGSDTVQWHTLQFEGNSGTDLKLTGNATNDASTVSTALQFANIKMEGGAAPGCPYIDLDYSQGCFFSNVHIGVHGGRNAVPLRKNHPFGGTRADKFVNLHIDNVGSDTFPYGIEHSKGALQLENITVLGASTAAIKVNSTVGANELQLGNLLTNGSRSIIDSRTSPPTVASAATVTPPRYGIVKVTGGTTITQVDAHEAGYTMTLVFAGALTVTNGGNLRLAGNFTTSADDTLTLVSDGTNWYEVARSVN